MFLVGGLHLIWSIEGFVDAAWLRDIRTGLLGDQLIIWAIIDLVLAVVAVIAGYSIWQGGKFGWWVGMIAAMISAFRWFFYIPWLPIAALTVIAIDILIIYGLAKYEDWFD
jgi:hypothetical protein